MDVWGWIICGTVLTGEIQKYLEKYLSHCHFVHHKLHTDRLEI